MRTSRLTLSLLFVIAGANHFISPLPYLSIMPPWLPWPLALIYVSGLAEIAGGIGLYFPATRKLAAFGLILLLVAVFPANIYAAFHGMSFARQQVPAWLLWVRLPLQPLLIVWVYLVGYKSRQSST